MRATSTHVRRVFSWSHRLRRVRLACLGDEAIAELRARPEHALALYRQCEPTISRAMAAAGWPAEDDALRGTFAMAAAHRFAPYGFSHAYTYPEIRSQQQLLCDNYAYLLLYLYEDIGGDPSRLRVHGFEGGTLANHAQVWVGSMLLDPTAGLAANISYEDALAGVKARRVLDFSVRDASPGYRKMVVSVIAGGLYTQSTVLYDHSVSDWYGMLAGQGLGRDDARAPDSLYRIPVDPG